MVEPEWATARLSYAGWVPNVGSHLSFSLIGSRSAEDVLRLSQRVERPGRIARIVCALQKRVTDDMLLPRELALRRAPDLRQDWLLVGETDVLDVPTGSVKSEANPPALLDRLLRRTGRLPSQADVVTTTHDEQGVLAGRVHVVPYEKNEAARNTQNAMLGTVRREFVKAARGQWTVGVIAQIEEAVIAGSPGVLTVNYALMRTGETRLWFSREVPGFNDHEHEQLARQAYFFIKDMSHRHVHHDAQDDQITPLVRFRNDTASERLESEVGWRRETLWNISRHADKMMGSDKLDDLRKALGQLAYADAFQKSLLPYIRDCDDALAYRLNTSAYGYDFQHIRESTRVRIDQTAAQRTVTGQLVAAIFAGAIASMSLVSSLISTHNGRMDPADWKSRLPLELPEWLLRLVAHYPLSVMVLTAYVLYSAFALTLSDILFTKPRRRLQALRGASLSIARQFELTPLATHRFLVGSYLAIIGTMLMVLFLGVYVISNIPDDVLSRTGSALATWASSHVVIC